MVMPCADGAGSINNPENPSFPGGPQPAVPYVPPELCKGTWDLTKTTDDKFQESVAAGAIEVSGATLNIFKLLGVHEQGKLVDLTGTGRAIGSSPNAANAFDDTAASWVSLQTGIDVVTTPAYLGYDFGPRLTSFGSPQYMPHVGVAQHITSFRITQPDAARRALQVRVDRAGDQVVCTTPVLTGTGNGTLDMQEAGVAAAAGQIMVVMTSPTAFTVTYIASTTTVLGVGTVNTRFNSDQVSFMVRAGSIPFQAGDIFRFELSPQWLRVDVVNVPNAATPQLVRIKQSAPSRYWRIVPLAFSGAPSGDPWEVDTLEMMDYASTRIDDIQDTLFMENRDRDYAKVSVPIRAQYSPLEAISDLSKFGFQVADIYAFSVVFASMVQALGRPIVVGDVIELPAEVQYDHNLKPVRKFLEVTDAAWAADGFTVTWRPTIFKFNATQLIPGQEHRDILGTVDTQKYGIDDTNWMTGLEQIQTAPLTVTEKNAEEARQASPERGTDTSEWRAGMDTSRQLGTYDGTHISVEDGLPPDGQPYETGFKMPDISGALDGQYFRLEYPPETKIPARLYKFSALKNKFIYIETDRRTASSSHKRSMREIFERTTLKDLKDKT